MEPSTRYLPPAPPAPELRDGVSLRSLLAVLRRRKLYLVVPSVAVTAAFVAAALLLPSRYRAEALLAIDQVADSEAAAAEAAGAAGRLDRVTEVLHRRSVLEPVIDRFDLYPAVREVELEEMRSRIRIQAAGPSTFSLGFVDRDAERSARVTARLAELLIANARAERRRDTGDEVELIEAQIGALETRLAAHEGEIEAYMERHGGELPEKDTSILGLITSSRELLHDNAATIAQLEARRSAIERETAELERLLAAERTAASPVRSRRAELERQLTELRGRYTGEHPEVLRLESELAALGDGAGDAAGAAAVPAVGEPSPLRLRYLQLVGERQEVEQRLGGVRAERGSILAETSRHEQRALAAPRHEIALAAMTRELEATETQYQELVKELHAARARQRLAETRQGGYQVVEAPRVPAEPIGPHRARIALMGLVLGVGLGVAAAFFTEQLDTSVRDAVDVESPTNLPVLAAIPSLPAAGGLRRLDRAVGPRRAPVVALLDDPHGAAGEQYRILATKLISQGGGAPQPTTLLVTSPMVGEGKTTTAVNLALALARMMKDESVLLVDADLGRPAVHRLLGLPLGDGLGRLLADPDQDPSRYVRQHRGLYLLEAGEPSPRTRSALASPTAQRLFQRLRQRYAYIVVDAPPVLTVAEGLILQHMVDSILLVVRAGVTPRDLVRRAVESLDIDRLAGVLLNDVAKGGPGYGYYSPYHSGGPPPGDAGGVDLVPAAGGNA